MLILSVLVACSVNNEELSTEDKNNATEIEDVDAGSASNENDLNNDIESKDKEVFLEEERSGVIMITGINLELPDEFPSDIPMPDEITIYYTSIAEADSEEDLKKRVGYYYEGSKEEEELLPFEDGAG